MHIPGDCTILEFPRDGTIECSPGDDGYISVGDTCTYKCNVGFFVNGNSNRICQSDGSWFGNIPTCDVGT